MAKFFVSARAVVRYCLSGVLVCAALTAVAENAPLAKLSNGEVVSEKDFKTYIDRRVDLKPLARNAWGVENSLREMLMTRVLVLEGQRLKEPVRTEGKLERFDDAYGYAIYGKLAKACTKSEDAAAVRKFYSEHPEVFTAPPSARLARVMLPASAQVDGSGSMAWLMSQAQEVAKGAKGFDQVANKAATIYKLETQGDLGWVNLTGDVAIMRALASAKPGEMVGPVKEGEFVYLFLLGEKREARLMKWEDVQGSAANTQFAFCREQANKELTDKLFKQYGVVIDSAAIKAMFTAPAPAPSSKATSSHAPKK